MSRFRGWDIAAVNRINCKNNRIATVKKENDYINRISKALDKFNIKHVKEYKFLNNRRFRFDIAIIEHRIAIEWEGGIFAKGRHVRGLGYANDVKKYNLATINGWRLLRYTTEDAKIYGWEGNIVKDVNKIISLNLN